MNGEKKPQIEADYSVCEVTDSKVPAGHREQMWCLTRVIVIDGVRGGFTKVAVFEDEREAKQFQAWARAKGAPV